MTTAITGPADPIYSSDTPDKRLLGHYRELDETYTADGKSYKMARLVSLNTELQHAMEALYVKLHDAKANRKSTAMFGPELEQVDQHFRRDMQKIKRRLKQKGYWLSETGEDIQERIYRETIQEYEKRLNGAAAAGCCGY